MGNKDSKGTILSGQQITYLNCFKVVKKLGSQKSKFLKISHLTELLFITKHFSRKIQSEQGKYFHWFLKIAMNSISTQSRFLQHE